MLINLTNAGIGVIGFDVVFAEEDKSSPHKVLQKLGIKKEDTPNYDAQFNYVVANTPTILGYQFELEEKPYIKKEELDIPVIIIEKNKQAGQDMLINATGTILNNKALQESGHSSGFFNNIPDDSGIVRSVPLIIRYDNQLYSSLGLEIIRASTGINKVFVNYSELGVENIQIGDFKIPTDRHGRLVVNYRGPSHTFKYISAIDIYNNNFNPKDVEGKVGLMGATAAGLNDLRATPFEPVYPGVEVHANVIDNILTQDFLALPNWVDGANLIIVFFLTILSVLLITYTPFWFNPFILFGLMVIVFYASFEALFTYGIIFNTFLPLIAIFSSILVATFMDYIFEVKNEEMIKKKFASKVSKEVMNNILKDPTSDTFAAMEKEVTVFFSDVRNFTNISESMPNAKLLIAFLNEYMNPMTQIIIEQKGTVDKFIGDAIMAYWNAPGDVDKHAERAIIASLEQLHHLKELNKKIKADKRFSETVEKFASLGVDPIDIGIGINTGIAVVGEMGSNERSDYTVIGDPVNIGARLESLCKFYDSKLNISSETKEHLEGKYLFRFLDYVNVKGKEEPSEIWQIHDYDDENLKDPLYSIPYESIKEELIQHHIAMFHYKNEEFDEALEIFEELDKKEQKSNEAIYQIYIQRCQYYIEHPPTNFNGVFTHTTKG
jgi:adenylate cyclase